MKYLGVTIDARMSFKDHLRNAGLKTSKVARVLADVMPNIGGSKQPRLLLLSSVVYSVSCAEPQTGLMLYVATQAMVPLAEGPAGQSR